MNKANKQITNPSFFFIRNSNLKYSHYVVFI